MPDNKHCIQPVTIENPKCDYLPQRITSVYMRKDENGNMELLVNDKVYKHGSFDIIKVADGTITIQFSY